MLKPLLITILLSAASITQAQVRVVESQPQGSRSGVSQPAPGVGQPLGTVGAVNPEVQAYFELQSLKEEVSMLRGMVEQQGYELSRLKQQQLDAYVDLDKRIVALSKTSSNISSSPDSNQSPSTPKPAAAAKSGLGDAETYSAAYDLLRQREVDSAITAFQDYLSRFPRGAYAGNSHYWLGEIYLLKNDLPQSRDWFSKLLEAFPDDRKVPDAKFKLGKVYHLLGNDTSAKELLNEVASGSGDSARLAKQYLQESF
jgi:tol-pal system protein YbgF